MFFKAKNIFIVFAVLLGLVFSYGKVLGDDLSTEKYNELKIKLDSLTQEMNTCNGLSEKAKIDCITAVYNKMTGVKAELDKYAKEIGAKAEELQKDIKSLSNQIGYLDAKVEKTEVEIRITQQEIDLINLDISKIEEEIKITEEEIKNTENKIEETRQRLADTIKKIYEYDTQNLVKITLTSGTLSDFFDEISYIENLQKSLSANLDQLKEEKKNLEEKKSGLEDQKASLAEKRREVSEKIDSFNKTIAELDASKREKAILLEITKGNEEEYQKLLAAIEEQKNQLLGNLSTLAQQKQSEITALIAKYGSIPPGLFDVPVFLQTNYPGVTLGPSTYSFSGNGCAVTSVAMVLAYYGLNVDPMTLNKDWVNIFSCASGGAFCWYGVTNSPYNMKISGQISHTYGSNINIDNYFVPGRPVIIFLNTRTNKAEGHYVVVVGKVNNKYVVNDPILGTVYLDVSKEFIENNYGRPVTIDQAIIYTPK